MNIRLTALLSFLFSAFSAFAQDSTETTIEASAVQHNLFKVGLGAGTFVFDGDVGVFSKIGKVEDLRLGYTLSLSQRFLTMFSANLNGFYGSVSASERSGARNLNFASDVMGGDFTIGLHLDNKYSIFSNGKFGPYLFGGVGYFLFDPKGDLKDANNQLYYYWSDGSTRDLPESQENSKPSKILKRDYKYETALSDPNNKYTKSALYFPIGVGVKVKLIKNLDFYVNGTYYLTQTDFLDNFKAGANNDAMWSATGGLLINFQGKSISSINKKQNYDVDVRSIVMKSDRDVDGVVDMNDLCPGTPEGTKVDARGCPLDKDKDGIPDYQDKEVESAKNTMVNDSGITVADSIFLARFNDSIVMNHDIICKVYPSLCDDKYVDSSAKNEGNAKSAAKLPMPYSEADMNNDGVITTDEIYKVIDRIFDDAINVNVNDVHKIIDYFFEH